MIEKNNGSYNIITGESRQPFINNVPEKLQNRVEEKYEAKKQR